MGLRAFVGSLLSVCKTKMENNNILLFAPLVVCTAYNTGYAVSYIFRLVNLGRKETKLNNEYL